MSPDVKQRIQLALAVAIAIAAARTGYIFYERRVTANLEKQEQQRHALDADYYVTPKKLYPYDLKSAQQLTQQPVWVKEGYRYTYYPYDPARHHVDFDHDAGLLLPIERLEIQDVVSAPTPKTPHERQVMAVFQKEEKSYAVPVGMETGGDYKIYSDEMFYIQDPHELYKHWPADVWDAIAKHQIKPGMNELQADFAVGMGTPDPSGDPSVKTVHYPNGGKPVSVTYRDGKAAEIEPKPPAS